MGPGQSHSRTVRSQLAMASSRPSELNAGGGRLWTSVFLLVMCSSLGSDEDQGAEVPRPASSERQHPAHVELVHLMARQLRGRAGAVGIAGQLRPGADRPGQAARRAGELPGAAGYLDGELRCPGKQAAARVD